MKKLIDRILSRWYVPRKSIEEAAFLIFQHHDIHAMNLPISHWGKDCPVCGQDSKHHQVFRRVWEMAYPNKEF